MEAGSPKVIRSPKAKSGERRNNTKGAEMPRMRATSWRVVWAALALLSAGTLTPLPATAGDYPSRPITLVVPFPPGGSTSIVARIVADKMSAALGQPIVIDNRGGAGGTIATRQVARAAPDGYTILLAYTGTLATGPSLYANAGYDPRTDFAPIGLIEAAPTLLVVYPDFPAHSLKDLIALAKAKPGAIDYASPGIGTVGHVAGELLSSLADIKLVHVPYKGTAAALTDVIGGHVGVMFSPIPAVIGETRSGALRALLVTATKRSDLAPDIPTSAEAGLPGLEAALRYGLVAPAGTPRPIIERLNQELNAALATPEVHKQLAAEGADLLPGTPEDYAADIDREETKWSKVVKASGAKLE
jgi:tripartite-type tricarboxylate transporter receptor subunit TctC